LAIRIGNNASTNNLNRDYQARDREICAPTITASSGALVAVGQWEEEEEGDKYQQLIAVWISLLGSCVVVV